MNMPRLGVEWPALDFLHAAVVLSVRLFETETADQSLRKWAAASGQEPMQVLHKEKFLSVENFSL